MRPLSSLAALLATSAVLGAPARQAPHADWRTIRTAHYRIHYPPVLADWAKDVASRVEGIHVQVTALVGYASPRPVQVVLVDPLQEANGMAVPLLDQPFVMLWRTHPQSDDPHAGAMTSWTEDVTVHEFAHIQHLTRPQNRRGMLSRLVGLPLGPLVLKAPRWVSEGYATLVEGKLTGSGRPHSAIRAVILRQWAVQGKLPDYEALSSMDGFLGGNMAYMVGSAYLEWLERQRPETPDILPRLWKQLASRKRRNFAKAFTATFGFDPKDGYDRFRAELSHDALTWEGHLKAAGLQDGTAFARFPGKVEDLSLSPNGKLLLARYTHKPEDSGLVVVDLDAKEPGKTPRKQREEARDATDPNEVKDVAPEFPWRKTTRLMAINGRLPERALWVDDTTIRFELKRRDEEGVLTRQPALWCIGHGPELKPATPPAPAGEVLWPIHRQGQWVLEYRGQTLPLPGQAIGRAWVDARRQLIYAGCELEGTWNLVRVPYQETAGKPAFGESQRLTRTVSAAWNPAPTPDGKQLYFTRLDARGTEIRVLDLVQASIAPLAMDAPGFLTQRAILPPTPEPDPLPAPAPVPASMPYRGVDNQTIRAAASLTWAPQGYSYQIGMGGADLLNRLSWAVLAGVGDGAGPRGALVGISSTAWRWNPSFLAFSALERPSRQRFSPRNPDQERRGAELALVLEDKGELPYWIGVVAAGERVQKLQEDQPLGDAVTRLLGGLRLGLRQRFSRGAWGFSTRWDGDLISGQNGHASKDESWTLQRGALALQLLNPLVPVVLKTEGGRLSGDPMETFQLGGINTCLIPSSLDLNRVAQPALPAYEAIGNRFVRYRAEVGGIARAYVEHTVLWNAGSARGPFQKVAGMELDFGPEQMSGATALLGKLHVSVGVHRPLNGLQKNRTVFTLSAVIRP
jgi:hypothetical protein